MRRMQTRPPVQPMMSSTKARDRSIELRSAAGHTTLMKRLIPILICAAATLLHADSTRHGRSAGWVLNYCDGQLKPNDEGAEKTTWYGQEGAYCSGLFDGIATAFHVPAGINTNQAFNIFAEYLRNHPEMMSQSAASVIHQALASKGVIDSESR